MTISTEISTLGTAISDIKTEIIEKGQSVSATDTVASLAPKIDNISNKNGEDFSKTVLTDIIEGTIKNLYDVELDYIRPYCFTGCDVLKQAWFTKLKKICRHAFDGCNQLTVLILEGNFVKLEHINAFKHTSLTKIYVKDSLLNTYKTDEKWSYYSDYIYKFSDF